MRGLPRVDFFYPQIICCTHIQNNTKAIGATTTIANPMTIKMSQTTSFRICIFFVFIYTVSLGVQKYSYMSCQKSPCHSLA